MILLFTLISFYLEGIFSLININYLIPLFTLMSLILIYPYVYHIKKDYYKICFFLGLLYDITYTDTLFLNAFIFLFIGYIITKISKIIKNNIYNNILISIIIISIYRIVTYIILLVINYTKFDILNLVFSIINSTLLNILYIIITYPILTLVTKKRGIYKLN